jgi:hypothetical protein
MALGKRKRVTDSLFPADVKKVSATVFAVVGA